MALATWLDAFQPTWLRGIGSESIALQLSYILAAYAPVDTW